MLGGLISGAMGLASSLFGAKKNEKAQKNILQNQLQWKAADAEKAGISKYFAMGAPTANFAPSSVGGDFSDFGKSIDKAIPGQGGAGATTTGKVTGISSAIAAAQLDGLKIDNDIKRAELASKTAIATQPGAGGILDHDVTTGPGGTKLKKEIAPAGYLPQKTHGVSPEVDLYRTHTGYAPQVPQQLQEAFENDTLGRWQWNLRNRIMPMWNMDAYGTQPKAGHFLYNPITGQYVEFPGQTGRPRDVKGLYDRLRR